jgi:Phosphoserine phosphatase RsbU, N-terminal domain
LNSPEFGTSYQAAFHDHVLGAREDTLRAAYELGREGVRSEMSLLDIAQAHHEALLAEILVQDVPADDVARAAGEFFLESISAFEMVRRGFEEARETALLHKSRMEMLRGLSSFLADTSLASGSSEPLEEVLRLIAEQGRELIGAKLCVVSLTGYGWSLGASSYAASELDGAGELEARPAAVTPLPEGRLTAAMESLDGEDLGSIELFGSLQGDFTAVDKAALVHLAQMASAAIERVHLHLSARPGDSSDVRSEPHPQPLGGQT